MSNYSSTASASHRLFDLAAKHLSGNNCKPDTGSAAATVQPSGTPKITSSLSASAANELLYWDGTEFITEWKAATAEKDESRIEVLKARAAQAEKLAGAADNGHLFRAVHARATEATQDVDEEATRRRIQQPLVPDIEVPFGRSTAALPLTPGSTTRQTASPKEFKAPAPTAGGINIDRESREILKYISEDFVMLASGSKLVAYHIASGDELGKEGFIQFCDKHYHEVLVIMPPDKEGKPVDPKRVSAGEIWWSWKNELRRVVRRIVMEPTSKPEGDDNPEVFNRWHMLKQTMAECDPKATAADIAILTNHLMYLSDGDVAGVTFFLCWLAQLYQKPEIKMPTAVLLYSKNGRVGKNLMQRLLTRVFGQPLVAGCTGKMLQKNFDDAIEHKRLVFINEMARSEKADGYEHFKSQVSEEFIQFEGKGRASKEIRNIAHFIITTNHEDALPLMEKDGRIAVLRCLAERQPDAYYDELVAWIDGPGAGVLANALATWEFPNGWNPHAPVPQTDAARAMQRAAQGDLYNNIAELIEGGVEPFDKDIIVVADVTAILQTKYEKLWAGRINTTSVGVVLKRMFGEPVPMRIEGLHGKALKKGETPPVIRVYPQRHVEQWKTATPKQRGDHLNTGVRLFAVQAPDDYPKTEVSDHEK
jgi:hypothetical protein